MKQICCLTLAMSLLLLNQFNARSGFSPLDIREAVNGNDQFAVDLYTKLNTGEGNLFFSPYSISTALAMACAGAKGDTEKQMAQTLHFDLPPSRLHPAFAELASGLNTIREKSDVRLEIANSIWPQKGFALLPDYLALCWNYYDAPITPVDYKGHTEEARKTINEWVENKTSGKISGLIQPGILDEDSKLVLADAIYFKGAWMHPFMASATRTDVFHTASGKSVRSELMQQEGDFRYAELPDAQILEMPYMGGEISMLVFLPLEVNALTKLEAKMTAKNITSWSAKARNQNVEAFLPKFKMTSEFALGATLTAMGMPDAFKDKRADFSAMDGSRDLFISGVFHKAFTEVNEAGTEAVAVTSPAVKRAEGEEHHPRHATPVFRADHPFLFIIRENGNGSILFMGRVMNPTAED
jgi:serpin B